MKERKYPGFSSNIELQQQGNYEVIYVFNQVFIPLKKKKEGDERKGVKDVVCDHRWKVSGLPAVLWPVWPTSPAPI